MSEEWSQGLSRTSMLLKEEGAEAKVREEIPGGKKSNKLKVGKMREKTERLSLKIFDTIDRLGTEAEHLREVPNAP